MRYAELAGNRSHGPAPVEGLHEYGLVCGRQVLERGGNKLPVQDLLQSRNRSRPPGRLPGTVIGRARRQLLGAAAAALALTPVLLALAPAVVALVLGRLPGA